MWREGNVVGMEGSIKTKSEGVNRRGIDSDEMRGEREMGVKVEELKKKWKMSALIWKQKG